MTEAIALDDGDNICLIVYVRALCFCCGARVMCLRVCLVAFVVLVVFDL